MTTKETDVVKRAKELMKFFSKDFDTVVKYLRETPMTRAESETLCGDFHAMLESFIQETEAL